jgi:phage portal protein BeeE
MNLNFWDAFFGRYENTSKRYIDQFSPNVTAGNRYINEYFGKKKAVWIDTSKAFQHYIEIPELRTVVNRKAKMISSGIPCLYNDKGEEITEHWVLDLIKNPNPTQCWDEVIYSMAVNDALYSTAFLYAPKRSFGIVNLLLPLASHKMQINTSGRTLKQMDSGGLIDSYVYNYSEDAPQKLKFEEVIMLQTTDGMNLLNPVSIIDSLKFPLSNIRAQYNKRNVLLENMGAIGILSAKKSDIGGALPVTPEEKKKIQRDWYNRSKDEVLITETELQWNPMSYPTKDLMLFEELTADKLAVIDAFGLNYYVFSNENGSTFSNVRDGIRMAYTDTIIPESDKIYDNLTEQLGLDKEGLRLKAHFDHIPVLQKDMLESSQALNSRAEALNKIILSGVVLTEDEKRALLNI